VIVNFNPEDFIVIGKTVTLRKKTRALSS